MRESTTAGCWPYIRPGWPLERARKPSNPAISRHQWQGFLVYGRRPGIPQAYHSATGAVLWAQGRRENPDVGAHVAVFAASLDSWADPPAVHSQPSRPGEADEQCRATAASSQSRLNQEVLLRTVPVVVILLLSLACSTVAAPTPVPIAAPMPTPTPTAMSVSPVTPSPPPIAASPTDRGLTITPENRCSTYDPDDYRYSQSVEPRIVASMGGTVYGPYTGRVFSSTRETDIEHIVARSEAHDSGLCAATSAGMDGVMGTCSATASHRSLGLEPRPAVLETGHAVGLIENNLTDLGSVVTGQDLGRNGWGLFIPTAYPWP